MTRRFLACAILILLFATGANAARYQRTKDGETIVWNSLRGVAQDVTWSGLRDLNGYATGEGTLNWYRLGSVVNSYTGKMVHGKFEGMVIKEQGQTRLQATFKDGEKVSNWVEPGAGASASVTPTATPREEPTAEPSPTEKPILVRPSRTPTPTPTPRPSATATLTPTPTPSPSPTPSPRSTSTSSPTPRPTPIPTPTSALTPTQIPTPPLLRSFSPSPVPEQSAEKTPQPEEMAESTPHDSLRLGISPSSTALARVSPAASPSPRVSARTSPTPNPKELDAKRRIIAEFKQETENVLAQAADATGNFREIEDLAKVQVLPAAVTAKITLLANQSRTFPAKVGIETARYECLAQIETVEALIIVDLITHDLARKDAPSARKKLSIFLERYSKPSGENQQALWRYLTSALSLCHRAKGEAEARLTQARSLEAAGKKSEALREYQEIYRIYPNPITAETIKSLENPR